MQIGKKLFYEKSERVSDDGETDQSKNYRNEYSKSSKFWMVVLQDLQSRGIKGVYLFCVDDLSGFRNAVFAAYPKADIQRCIIYQMRSSTRYVGLKDIKAKIVDLKKVYQAVTPEGALQNLLSFKDNWGKQYPSCLKSW